MSRLQIESRSSRRFPRSIGSLVLAAIGLAALAVESWAGVPGPFPRTRAALASATDSFGVPGAPAHAFWLAGVAGDFVYDAPASFIERANGTARLVGRIHSASNPSLQFLADVSLSTRIVFGDSNFHPPGSPTQELKAIAYAPAGGPVEVDDFYYYDSFDGTLTGFGALDGAKVAFTRTGTSFQVGVGANGMNVHDGMEGALAATTLAQPSTGATLPAAFDGYLNSDLWDELFDATVANGDGYAQFASGFALNLEGIDELSLAPGTRFQEFENGTARLSGIAVSLYDGNAKFAVEIAFTGRVQPGDAAYPPAGGPNKELKPAAYVENGGPIDSGTWRYYTAFHGTLLGIGDFAGGVVDVSQTGAAFQVGFGANGKNGNAGASAALNQVVVHQPNTGYQWPNPHPIGFINIDLGSDVTQAARSADLDAFGQGSLGSGGFALQLTGIGHCKLDSGASFVERADGTAKLTGIATAAGNPNAQFSVAIDFSQRLLPTDASYPPASGPVENLLASAYVQNGGFVDSGTWRYYTLFDGSLVGLGDFAGAQIDVSSAGAAFQVGVGANGKNARVGGSGSMAIAVNSQPATATQWSSPGTTGEIAIDLLSDFAQDAHTTAMTAVKYGAGCSGYGPLVPSLDVLGSLLPGTTATLSLTNSNPHSLAFLLLGLDQASQYIGFGGCYLLVSPVLVVGGPYLTDASGRVDLTQQLPLALVPGALRLQYALDPMTPPFAVSNGVEILVQ